jgi:recyclin-1
MKEMVYEDAKWVQRLKRMNVWNEAEARQRKDSHARSYMAANGRRQSTLDHNTVNGKGRPLQEAVILPNGVTNGFVSSPVARGRPTILEMQNKAPPGMVDGFDTVTLSGQDNASNSISSAEEDPLTVLERVRSIRGQARQEYSKVYKALQPFYIDALASGSPMQCLVFKKFPLPEQQAQLLSHLITFSHSDFSPGSEARERQLSEITSIFATAALLEFRKGYEFKDIQGQMRQYAHVMHTLNGGQTSIDLYLAENRMLSQKSSLGNVADCLDYSMGHGQLSLQRTQGVFDRIGGLYEQELAIIKQVFPDAEKVSMLFLKMVGREIFAPFLSLLFNDAHARGRTSFLRIVSGTFAQTRQFFQDYAIGAEARDELKTCTAAVLTSIYEPHIDLYLAEELAAFKQKADAEIDQWDKSLSEQAASMETFLMSNVNRQADKKDFMTSFKKVVMMPVNILPSFSGPSDKKSTAKNLVNGDAEYTSNVPSRSSTPGPSGNPYAGTRSSVRGVPDEAPTTELAAKAAVMASKLEGIRSLFSIEVALNLVHAAKSSLERAAQFIVLEGSIGDAAKHQSVAIFILLLTSVGSRHVKAGFDKAIDHLGVYNPREAKSDSAQNPTSQVAPLATFLELVNVGDLIQQMLDVFYESELVRLQISNRDDFLDPSVKEKKKFEAMLDERVAAGLGKGIDVLMDEVEYICATTQMPTDFNPTTAAFDIGPTPTARRVIDVVGSHIAMLTGSTDKTLLDVFSGEVGLRLFTTLCKHLKRQRISTAGAMPLLSDLGAYASYIATLRNNDLNSYFVALREVGQIYLIEGTEAKEMAVIIADGDRYGGVFNVEEVLEFAERRSDWLVVKPGVERAMYGQGCVVM